MHLFEPVVIEPEYDWLVIDTAELGVAIEHVLVRRYFFELLVSELTTDVKRWLRESHFQEAIQKALISALTDKLFAKALATSIQSGRVHPAVNTVIQDVITKGYRFPLLHHIGGFVLGNNLPEWMTRAIADVVAKYSLSQVTQRTFHVGSEDLRFYARTRSPDLGPQSAFLQVDDEDDQSRLDRALRFEEEEGIGQPLRGRLPNYHTARMLQRATWFYFAHKVLRRSRAQITVSELDDRDENPRNRVYGGIDRITQCLALGSWNGFDGSRAGVWVIMPDLDVRDSSGWPYHAPKLA